jgi:hypothetical protein
MSKAWAVCTSMAFLRHTIMVPDSARVFTIGTIVIQLNKLLLVACTEFSWHRYVDEPLFVGESRSMNAEEYNDYVETVRSLPLNAMARSFSDSVEPQQVSTSSPISVKPQCFRFFHHHK